MKNSFCQKLAYGCVLLFLFFWISMIILALPSNLAKNMIAKNAPRLKAVFGSSWKLFTPPYTYHNRLYYIVRDIHRRGRPDTIEVLENISLQKQRHAPFNQQENIIDHLVNNNVAGMIRAIWTTQTMPAEAIPGVTDSSYVAAAVAAVSKSKHYLMYLATLNNYGKVVLKVKHIDAAGKEVKIVIKTKMIRPFKEMNNPHFLQKEFLVFETPYEPVNQ